MPCLVKIVSTSMPVMPQQVINASHVENINEKNDSIQTWSECHDLSCIDPQHSNTTCLLYDISNPTPIRKCNIPEVIHCNKHNSLHYNQCIQH